MPDPSATATAGAIEHRPATLPVSLTAIVPATNTPSTLPRCLQAIERSEEKPEQVIVVDDPSIKHPALARNAGARRATGDVLVFVDADVTVHPDAFVRIREAFRADSSLVALFGSYDDTPASPGIVSVFRNLLHHHVHQSSAGPTGTFWAGLGAMRRDAFRRSGGFIEHPIEDIELGMRLAAAGARIVLDPEIQGKHLKKWGLWNMIRTDLLVRGIPWVGLLLEHHGSANLSTLNLGWRHRLSAVASLVILTSAVIRSPSMAVGALVALIVFNLSFYRLLTRREGFLRATAGLVVHVVHHLVSVLAAVLGPFIYLARRRQVRPGAI